MTKEECQALETAAAALKEEAKRIQKLPKEEKAAAKKEQKEKQKQHKADVKAMPKDEREAAKRHDKKLYGKLHPIRRVMKWAAAFLAIVLVIAVTAVWLMVGALAGRALTAGFDLNSEQAVAAQQASREMVVAIEEEGIVLLKNEGSILPLEGKTAINVFGTGSVNSVFGGGGSGSADTSNAVTLQQGLEHAGFTCNPTLVNLYSNWVNSGVISTEDSARVDTSQARGLEQTVSANYDSNELPKEGLSEEVIADAKNYSDVAVVVISRTGSEGTDLSYNYLQLSQNERDLMDIVCSHFDKVVILLNTCNTMELGWIEEYPSIQGALWIGCVGNNGMNAVGNVLNGSVNPSGRTVDTYAYDLMSNPANIMTGSQQWSSGYQYDNLKNTYFVHYYEGIYVGYRYYETRYMDNDAAYWNAVQYPFGYGLSYTQFQWDIVGEQMSEEAIFLQVSVTNTGDRPGKDVVEVYYSAPYYPERGIEKSSTALCAFGKTKLLEPGESEILTLQWNTADMASYDQNTEKAYVLDEGDYEIRLCKDSHRVVDTRIYTQEERAVYAVDPDTGAAVTNRFDGSAGKITILSREDWAGTWPDGNVDTAAPQEAVDTFTYVLEKNPDAKKPTTNANNHIMLRDLTGLGYDDPMWEDFLDQMKVSEMARLSVDGGYGTMGIERLGVPAKKDMDGPAAINNIWAGTSGVQFPGEVVLASTWNTALAAQMGNCIAGEALAYNVIGWYGPGANIHRSAFGGRNFEYYSEDPLLSGEMAASEIEGAQGKGIVCYVKHFALNEQENHRNDNGLYTWCGEQAIREIYLTPFENAIKTGRPTGVMSAFNRIGSTWCGGNDALLNQVLRGEWGFDGVVVSDATHAVFWPYMNQVEGIMNGNDLFLDYGSNYDYLMMRIAVMKNPAEVTAALRKSSHNILYSIANSAAMEE